MQRVSLALLLAALFLLASPGNAQEMRINLPKRTKPTPVQQLNRDGVKFVERHDYNKAKKLFYKAYLLDPNDPFTLNNLGYMAEIEGDLDRAQRYYGLASELSSDALIDKSTNELAEGKPVSQVAGNAADRNMQVNRLNVEAISLLMKDRAPEADLVLQKALKVDSRDAFTLNNMGFVKEKEGELQKALSYYSAAAASGSQERIVVTTNSDWRGKPIAEIADRNARKVRHDVEVLNQDVERQVALLNLRGVSALNRNETDEAEKDFQSAYKLDPQNAFAVNNMGYIAELQGDRETADFYYAKAREADHAGSTVHLATRKEAEGRKLTDVAQQSDDKVQASMEAVVAAKRQSGQPVELRRRDNSVVQALPMPASDQAPSPSSPPQPPASEAQPEQPIIPPLENQPGAQTPPPNPAPAQAPAQPVPVQPSASPAQAPAPGAAPSVRPPVTNSAPGGTPPPQAPPPTSQAPPPTSQAPPPIM